MEKFDVIVIGSGPAGEKAAAQAAYFEKKVLLIEKEVVVGGAMVNTGTIPSKTLRETSHGDFILIAVGSTPFRPGSIPFEEEQVYDSDEILLMEKIPGSMVIIGAGVIGCEYACMFAALGIDVTLVDPKDTILPFLDE